MQPDGTLDLRRGGNRLVITSDGTSDQDVIQQVKRDRVTRAEPWLLAGDISKGGHLEFKLGSGPSSWAKNPTPPTRPDK